MSRGRAASAAASGMPDFEMPSAAELEHARLVAYEAALVRERDLADLASAAAARNAVAEVPSIGARAHAQAPPARTRLGPLVRNPVIAFVAGLVLAGGAGFGWPALQGAMQRGSEAELQRIVDEYVALVEDGDVEAAMRMDGLDSDNADRSLLDAGARPDEPPIFACDAPRIRDQGASVLCTSTQDGVSGMQSRINLVRDNGWRIDRGLAVTVRPYSEFQSLVGIDGVPIAPASFVDPSPPSVWLYPGEYPVDVRVPQGMVLIEDAPVRLSVAEGGAWVTSGFDLGSELRGEAEATAVAFVEACASAPGPGCPELGSAAAGTTYEIVAPDQGYSSSDGTTLTVTLAVRPVGSATNAVTM